MSSAFLRLVVDASLEVTGKGRLIIINKFPENNRKIVVIDVHMA